VTSVSSVGCFYSKETQNALKPQKDAENDNSLLRPSASFCAFCVSMVQHYNRG